MVMSFLLWTGLKGMTDELTVTCGRGWGVGEIFGGVLCLSQTVSGLPFGPRLTGSR